MVCSVHFHRVKSDSLLVCVPYSTLPFPLSLSQSSPPSLPQPYLPSISSDPLVASITSIISPCLSPYYSLFISEKYY